MATSIRLEPEIEQKLDFLATHTGRTKAFYLRELISRGMEDLEEYYLAADLLERVRKGEEETLSSAEVRRLLDLEN
jgi:RHH-type rel operon transcriptional repressor/antitoxin RelB